MQKLVAYREGSEVPSIFSQSPLLPIRPKRSHHFGKEIPLSSCHQHGNQTHKGQLAIVRVPSDLEEVSKNLPRCSFRGRHRRKDFSKDREAKENPLSTVKGLKGGVAREKG